MRRRGVTREFDEKPVSRPVVRALTCIYPECVSRRAKDPRSEKYGRRQSDASAEIQTHTRRFAETGKVERTATDPDTDARPPDFDNTDFDNTEIDAPLARWLSPCAWR